MPSPLAVRAAAAAAAFGALTALAMTTTASVALGCAAHRPAADHGSFLPVAPGAGAGCAGATSRSPDAVPAAGVATAFPTPAAAATARTARPTLDAATGAPKIVPSGG